ncbi:MAG: hypothetical protein SFU91_07640 [Chloroherpetonaceae bacterium]|nr:hypothetical protein [Chloroherpetonaceae bacterium]
MKKENWVEYFFISALLAISLRPFLNGNLLSSYLFVRNVLYEFPFQKTHFLGFCEEFLGVIGAILIFRVIQIQEIYSPQTLRTIFLWNSISFLLFLYSKVNFTQWQISEGMDWSKLEFLGFVFIHLSIFLLVRKTNRMKSNEK